MTPLEPTLGQSLLAAVRQYGEAWFLRLAKTDGSFQDLDRRRFLDMALRVAGWCREQGLSPGDRAILCLENSPAWGAAYFGIILAGGVAVPLDAQSVLDDTTYCLQKSGATLVFASRPELFSPALPAGCVLSHALDGVLAFDPLPEAAIHDAKPQDLAVLIFTSGTTGRPKAVMLTHSNLLANVESIGNTGLVTPRDNFLAVLPLHHAYPCMVNLLVPLFLGARTTFVETLKPEAILTALRSARVSLLVLTPQYVGVFYRRIRKRFEALPFGTGRMLLGLLQATAGMRPDPLGFARRVVRRGVGPNFRFFLTGGAKCELEVIQGMGALGIGVQEGYGLSETAPVVSFNLPDSGKPGSVGTPMPGVEVRIDAPDSEGFGEILVRGPNVMPGYFQDPEATARAIRDGWFHTGDQGRMDQDGSLYVRGRERDVIVLPSGKKFPAEEVEAHYRQAPSIGDVCVLQGASGALQAVITPNQEFFRTTDSPDVRHNIRWDLEVLSKSLPPYKRIGTFVIVPGELPKTRLGKIKRHLVEKMLAEGQDHVAEGPAWPELTLAGEKALGAIREVSGMATVAPLSHLELDLGLDSLKRLELLTLLEDGLGRSVPEERFQRLATAGEVVELVKELAGGVTGQAREAEFSGGSELSQGRGEGGRSGLGTERMPRKGAELRKAIPDEGGAGERAGFNLDAALSPELAAKVRLTFSPADRLATAGLGLIVNGAARLGFGLTVRGADNIPDGAAIICPNHSSFLDAFMLFAATPKKQRMRLYFLGLARFLDPPVVKLLAARLRLIAVDATRMSETMRLSAYALGHGGLLCVFPEGSRTVTGELQEFKKGPVILSQALQVPVVPAAISGTFEAWPVGGRIRLHKVTVTFGKPMMPDSPEDIRGVVSRLLKA